ncbi:MAG: hypothetical protein WCZ87_03540 [Thiohalobacteraceae bacterium]
MTGSTEQRRARRADERPAEIAAPAEALVEQCLALGMDNRQATQLAERGCAALNQVLAEIDLRAFVAVPVAEQVSMLLPRLDIDGIARAAGVTIAQAQSAMAILTLDFATRVR